MAGGAGGVNDSRPRSLATLPASNANHDSYLAQHVLVAVEEGPTDSRHIVILIHEVLDPRKGVQPRSGRSAKVVGGRCERVDLDLV
jgi:hypothetical protein